MTSSDIIAAARAGQRLCMEFVQVTIPPIDSLDVGDRTTRVKRFWLEPGGADIPVDVAEAAIATGELVAGKDDLFGGAQSWGTR